MQRESALSITVQHTHGDLCPTEPNTPNTPNSPHLTPRGSHHSLSVMRLAVCLLLVVLGGCAKTRDHRVEVTTDCVGGETLVEIYLFEVHQCKRDCDGIIQKGEPEGKPLPGVEMLYRSWPEGADDYMLWYEEGDTVARCVVPIDEVGEPETCTRPSGVQCTMSVEPLD